MSDETTTTPAPEPAPAHPAPEAPDPARAGLDALLRAWAYDRLADSPVARATGAWNHVLAEIDGLRDRIAVYFKV